MKLVCLLKKTDVLQEVEAQFQQALADVNNDRVVSGEPRLATPHVQRDLHFGRIDFVWYQPTKGAIVRTVSVEFQQNLGDRFLCVSAEASLMESPYYLETPKELQRYRRTEQIVSPDPDPEEIIDSLRLAMGHAFSWSSQDMTSQRMVTVTRLARTTVGTP